MGQRALHLIIVEIWRYVDNSQHDGSDARLVDALCYEHVFVEKVPVVSTALLSATTTILRRDHIACTALSRAHERSSSRSLGIRDLIAEPEEPTFISSKNYAAPFGPARASKLRLSSRRFGIKKPVKFISTKRPQRVKWLHQRCFADRGRAATSSEPLNITRTPRGARRSVASVATIRAAVEKATRPPR